jgi:integration host factor subunit alpha
MALTKADMAESLFNELGLNKREARELVDLYFENCGRRSQLGSRLNFPASGTLIFGIKTNVRDEIQRPVKKFRSPRDEL